MTPAPGSRSKSRETGRPVSWFAFQAGQETDQVIQFRTGQLAAKTRHGAFVKKLAQFAQVPLTQGTEVLAGILQLNGKGVFIQPYPADSLAVRGDGFHKQEILGVGGPRLDQRLPEVSGAAPGSDLGQFRS